MTDIAEMTPISSGKAKAGNKGAKAKGAALAVVCIKYATKQMEEQERQSKNLAMIVRSISELERQGHAEFRAELTRELALLKELRDTVGVTKEQTQGYAFASFEVLVTNWKTISTACELGYKPEQKAFGLVVAEAVQMKHAHANAAREGAQLPTKRKAGRKAISQYDKTMREAEKLLDNPKAFLEFAAWVETQVKAMKPSVRKGTNGHTDGAERGVALH